MMKFPVHYDEKTKIWSTNSKQFDDALNTNIGEYILKRLNELNSNKVIEINYDNDQKWTVNDYKRLSITCAINLKRLGLKKGDIVVYFCTLNSYITVSVYGCYYIGAIVHPVDVNCTEDDLDYSLGITDPIMILCDDNVYERVQSAAAKGNLKNLKYILSFGQRGDNKSVKDVLFKTVENLEHFQIDSKDLGDPEKLVSVLLSSSGSTNVPKVSILSHSTMLHGSLSWWNPNENSVIFCASLFRWISQSAMIIQSAHFGYYRIITGKRPSAETTANIIHKYKITHLFALPTLLIDTFEYAKKHQLDLSSLELALTGGESTPEYLMVIGKEVVPKCKIIACYGMTEVGRTITSKEGIEDNESTKNSVGYLTEGLQVKITGSNGELLGPNQKGQICLKSKHIFLGYWHGDRKTSEAFDKDGWLKTGDFGYFDENRLLYIIDRYKDIISFDGTLIFPNPIERVLENHRAVLKAIIVGLPHEKGQIPVAFIKLKTQYQNASAEEKKSLNEDIEKYLVQKVASDQLPSGGIYFVEEFPLTFTGKVFREELKKIAADLINKCKSQ